MHFRPSTYWPANTEVTLDANLYGVDFGEGVWGEKDRAVSFSIGAKHVSIADAATHMMEVYDGDQLVQTYPISAGSPDNPSYNGPHVVTELNRDRIMDSSTYGVPVDSPEGYRTPVEYAVRISDSGEFVHAAPWSVAQQGEHQRLARLHQHVDRAGRLVLQLLPARATSSRSATPVRAICAPTSTTGPSRGRWRAGSALK